MVTPCYVALRYCVKRGYFLVFSSDITSLFIPTMRAGMGLSYARYLPYESSRGLSSWDADFAMVEFNALYTPLGRVGCVVQTPK